MKPLQFLVISVFIGIATGTLVNIESKLREIRDDARAWHDAGTKP